MSSAEPDREGELRFDRILPLLIAVAGFAVYLNSFAIPFVWDDHDAILTNPHVRQLWPIWEAAWAPRATPLIGRPLASLTLALNYAVSGFDVWSYHLLNVLIHVLTALTLFGVVRRTLLTGAPLARLTAASDTVAFVVALIWVVHPLHTEVVTNVSTRTEALFGLFLLLTLYATVRGATSGRARSWYAAAVVACVLGMASKQVMIVTPLLVLLYDRAFLAGSFRQAWRQRTALYVGLAATWGILAVLVATSPGVDTVGFHLAVTPLAYALTQFGIIVHYLRLAFWPHPLVLVYDWPLARTAADILPAALLIAGLLALTAWAVWRRSGLGFLGAAFFLILAPTSSILPIRTEIAAERRMYLPLAAVILIVVLAVWWLAQRLPARTGRRTVELGVLALAVVTSAATATWLRNQDYRDEETLYRTSIAGRPTAVRPRVLLGDVLYARQDFAEGLAQFQAAAQLDPNNPIIFSDIGVGLTQLGRLEEAVAPFARAVALAPSDATDVSNLGTALARVNRVAEAAIQFAHAVKLAPSDPYIRTNYGRALALAGDLDAAASQFQAALELDPARPAVHFELAQVCTRQGRAADAVRHFTAARDLAQQQNEPELVRVCESRLASLRR